MVPAQRMLKRFVNMRVLIIDDERSIRTSTMVAIQAAGHQAETADSGDYLEKPFTPEHLRQIIG